MPKAASRASSDAMGRAELVATGCGCDEVRVYVETLPGYKLRTPEQCTNGYSFGLAPSDAKDTD
jgi:hypothetical protein